MASTVDDTAGDALDMLMHMLQTWGISLTYAQGEQLRIYATELYAWNQRINLTSDASFDVIMGRHITESLRCALSWGHEVPDSLVDIGTGAGFPALPLKIAFPSIQLTLIESVGKKVAFLAHIVSILQLANVTILHERAERVGHDPQHRERYACATARAVGSVGVIAEYGLPLLRIGGRLVCPKGAQSEEEVAVAARAIDLLGGRLIRIENVELPQRALSTVVLLEKVAPTPARYPRRVGVVARRPIR